MWTTYPKPANSTTTEEAIITSEGEEQEEEALNPRTVDMEEGAACQGMTYEKPTRRLQAKRSLL